MKHGYYNGRVTATEERSVDRLFLDANVLYSAAVRPRAKLAQFWELSDVQLLTSTYAVKETKRQAAFQDADALARLDALLGSVEVVEFGVELVTEWDRVALRAKDVPILEAAIYAKSTHLITGDKRDFGPLAGQVIEGVQIVYPPALYLDQKTRS